MTAREAFLTSEIYRDRCGVVRGALLHAGIRGAALDELMQDVFALAWRKKVFDSPWLRLTAQHVAANYRRRRCNVFEVLDSHSIEDALYAAEELDERVAVRRAMGALQAAEAELLVKRVLRGVTLRELGQELGLTTSGAHGRVERARRRFLEVLECYGERVPSRG